MKNVLIVHDISCYGKCSTTVALPIISSMSLTGTLLPSALLSTHTGPGFEHFTFLDLSEEMRKIVSHWQSFDLKFDAVYVGYLGKINQIQFLKEVIPQLLKPNGKFYLDPVMADHGKYYYGFNSEYAKEMLSLCQIADVIMPNQTEFSFLFQTPYQQGKLTDQQQIEVIHQIKEYTSASLVLTGAGFDDQGKTGAFYYDARTNTSALYQADFVGGNFHGTGDIFGSILVGALVNGRSLAQATEFAVKSLPEIIQLSLGEENLMRDGLAFERYLGKLSQFVKQI